MPPPTRGNPRGFPLSRGVVCGGSSNLFLSPGIQQDVSAQQILTRPPDRAADRAGLGPPADPLSASTAGWIRRARGGDVHAFERLYRAHLPRVYALTLRMTADPDRAEDLTQDAFVRAWDRLPSFRGDSAFGTWLHRLAVNVVLGDLRSRGRWAEETLEDEGSAAPARELRTVPAHAGEAVDLERAVAALPPRARTVLVLHDIEGYRHREIAELLGVTDGTSKAQLFRARRLLREALDS